MAGDRAPVHERSRRCEVQHDSGRGVSRHGVRQVAAVEVDIERVGVAVGVDDIDRARAGAQLERLLGERRARGRPGRGCAAAASKYGDLDITAVARPYREVPPDPGS